jgi:hypothetical protein
VDSRLHFYRISWRRALALAALACAGFLGAGSLAARAQSSATLSTGTGCYVVGQTVRLTGSGFMPSSSYVVTVGGVYLGQETSNASGGFSVAVHPGGLPAGVAQHVDQLTASDGTNSAATTFTLTRKTGARIVTSGSNPQTLKAQFQAWGYSLSGSARAVYVHYLSPSGSVAKTVSLGHTSGQCGYLRTGSRLLFPLSISSGTWTLQLDTKRSYHRHPGGPVTRISVRISG